MGNRRSFYHGGDVRIRGDYYRHNGTTYVDIELTAGLFKVVADITERDNIPAEKRAEGLTVFVVSEKSKYQLIGGVGNTDWAPMNLTVTFPNGGTNSITVGNITREKAVIIDYVMERGSLVEIGNIMVTNKVDTRISRSDDFDYCGIEFEKLIDGDNITLSGTDALSNGNDTYFWGSLNRLMF